MSVYLLSFFLYYLFQDKNDVQVLWRLSKAEYNMSLDENISKEKKKSLISSAHKSIIKALSIDSNISEVHKWAAVLIDAYSNINLGIKEQLLKLETVKFHLQVCAMRLIICKHYKFNHLIN